MIARHVVKYMLQLLWRLSILPGAGVELETRVQSYRLVLG